jgi:hypothetical protein
VEVTLSNNKLRLSRTDPAALLSNLRGEVGEIITTWTILRSIMSDVAKERTADLAADMNNRRLTALHLLSDKLSDEIVARLSELGENKIGRLNFHFATEKLDVLKAEAGRFSTFVQRHGLKRKRDCDISHKRAPESWHDDNYIRIPYRLIVRGVAGALRVMKMLDRAFLGPAAPYLWRKQRTKRYKPLYPPRAGYGLLPYLYLTPEERAQIIVAEMKEGLACWEPMQTTMDGQSVTIRAYRKWGAIALGDRIKVLEVYPLNQVSSLTFHKAAPETSSP